MRMLLAIIGLVGLTAAAPQAARSEVNFSIFVSNAPPPPRAIFHHEPRFVLVEESQVYLCEDDYYSDYDVFRYGPHYYMWYDGFWYRANSYHGPFVAIRIGYVPRVIFSVSNYGYRWRQAPRWDWHRYGGWVSRDGRYSDRHYHSNWQERRSRGDWDGRTRGRDTDWRDRRGDRDGGRLARAIQERRDVSVRTPREADRGERREVRRDDSERSERRVVQAPRERGRDGDREWRDSKKRGDGSRGQAKADGKGKTKAKGKGHGQGRGHDKE